VQATGGIILSQSLTTKASTTTLRGGTGALKILDRRTLSTTGQLLTITADDIVIQGGISTGAAALIIATEGAKSIGLGLTTMQMNIDNLCLRPFQK
jgi:hypothetical protein